MLRRLTLFLALASVALAQATVEPPSKLLLRIEGFTGASYSVELVPDSSTVRYRHNSETFTNAESTKEEKIEIAKERWAIFWKRLEDAKVWTWKKRYTVAPNPPDGTAWSVTLDWSGHSISSSGVNAYPDAKQFGLFKSAVSELLEGRKFE